METIYQIRRQVVWAAILLLAITGTSAWAGNAETVPQGAELGPVMDAIRGAIRLSEEIPMGEFPRFRKATITLNTVTTRSRETQLSLFFIISLKTKSKAENASSITLTITKPPDYGYKERNRDIDNVRDALARSMYFAKLAAYEARRGNPELNLSTVKIDIKFAVQFDVSAGTIMLLPLGLKHTSGIARGKVHSITMEFAEPDTSAK